MPSSFPAFEPSSPARVKLLDLAIKSLYGLGLSDSGFLLINFYWGKYFSQHAGPLE